MTEHTSPYSLDEIITSIMQKPFRTGFRDEVSDSVDVGQYLKLVAGETDIREHELSLPLTSLRILQPDIEPWRYLRLCSLSRKDFDLLAERKPIDVVRGRMVEGYPLIQGNHRALYALMHSIKELPAIVHFIADEDAAYRFEMDCQRQYWELDSRYDRHDVGVLKEEYKDFLGELVYLRSREYHSSHGERFALGSAEYKKVAAENKHISAEVPCISLSSYIRSLQKIHKIQSHEFSFSHETVFYRQLIMTQPAIEQTKLERIIKEPRLLDAPILLQRTRLLDYVVAGHTRLRARLDKKIERAEAIVIYAENDELNRFLDTQATQSGYLVGGKGIRHMKVLEGH